MGTIIFTGQADHCDSLVDEAGVLSRTYVGGVISAAGECVILQRATPQFEPFQQACADIIHQLKLNWPPGLLLNHGGSISNFPMANDVADPDLHQVAPAQLAIDGQIKEGSIPNATVLIQKKRTAHIWRGLSARFAPTLRPAFHDTRSRAAGSNSDNPMTLLLWP